MTFKQIATFPSHNFNSVSPFYGMVLTNHPWHCFPPSKLMIHVFHCWEMDLSIHAANRDPIRPTRRGPQPCSLTFDLNVAAQAPHPLLPAPTPHSQEGARHGTGGPRWRGRSFVPASQSGTGWARMTLIRGATYQAADGKRPV